jgi:hypothetical protein
VLTSGAFTDCSSLTEVHLSEGIEYLGPAFEQCKSLRYVHLPSTLYECKAFTGCKSLTELHLPKGFAVTLADGAFAECKSWKGIQRLLEDLLDIDELCGGCISLHKISIPPTVTTIDYLFGGNTSLTEVHLSEGLVKLDHAFRECTSLTRVDIPGTVSVINEAFVGCTSLVEIHFREGLKEIRKAAFKNLPLLHVNIPSTVTVIKLDAFQGCPFLRNIDVSPSSVPGQIVLHKSFRQFVGVDCSFDDLRTRFGGLPVHRACFYLSHQSMESKNQVAMLKNLVSQHTHHCARVDCLGMTPLHVLACSAVHDLGLYQFVVGKYLDAMTAKDKWGEAPVVYVLISGAPANVVNYFLETHKRNWGEMPFGISEMVKKLAICRSGEYVRCMIRTLKPYFSDVEIDWGLIIDESIRCKVPLTQFRDIVMNSMSARSNCMSMDDRMELDQDISFLEEDLELAQADPFRSMYKMIRERVVEFTQLQHEFLLNASTTLELALWSAVITESSSTIDLESKMRIRANCGSTFQVVIPNVVSFLNVGFGLVFHFTWCSCGSGAKEEKRSRILCMLDSFRIVLITNFRIIC